MSPTNLHIIGIKWPPETFLQRKINGLLQAGFHITVWTPEKARSQDRMNNLRVESLLRSRLLRLLLLIWKLLRYPLPTFYLMKIILREQTDFRTILMRSLAFAPYIGEKADILHYEWTIGSAILQQFLECPMVVSCRGSQVTVRPHNPLKAEAMQTGLNQSFEEAAAVHCVSEAIKQEAMKYGLDPAKAYVIRPAVDPDFFYPLVSKNTNATPIIISTGSLVWLKGYEYALLAIRKLIDNGHKVKFQIVGDGPQRNRLLYTIFDLELEQYVELLGKLPPSVVRERLQNADIFLLSSLSEGISNAVLEAMSCGLPIVTTDCGGMREAVTNGVEGFVVSPRDHNATALMLGHLLSDLMLRDRMGKAGRERVLKEFTMDQQTSKFVQMYQTVIAQQCLTDA